MKHILLIPNIEKDPNYAVTLAAIAVLRNAGAVLYADDMHISALGCHGVQSISCASGIPHAIEVSRCVQGAWASSGYST